MKGMNACKMSIEHKGVTINLSFENGNISSKRNAKLTTENRFVQDAIEAMPIFGTRIVLTHTMDATPVKPVEVEEDELSPKARRRMSRAERAVKKSAAPSDGNVVESVKNVNDAVSYFEERGILVESKEHLTEVMEKHNVVFPNLSK